MKPSRRPGILLEFLGLRPDWPQGFLVDNLAAAFHIVDGPASRSEILSQSKPDIALFVGGTAIDCREALRACRQTSPGMLLVILGDFSAEAAEELNREFEPFALAESSLPPVEIVALLKKAIAFVRLVRSQMAERRERHERRHFPGQWLMSQEVVARREKLAYAQSLIRNILHTASQGLGIGAVITYVDLMKMSMQAGAQGPQQELFDQLVTNADAARHWLGAFENILKGLQRKFPRERLAAEDLNRVIHSAVMDSENFRAVKGHTLLVEPIRFGGEVMANQEAVHEIVCELLLNAFKYSPAKSTVRLMHYTTADFVALTVVNDIEQMRGGVTGIPVDCEERIFEPFFRLNNAWDDRYREQKLGLGVGLTLAENAAHQTDSRLYVYELEMPFAAQAAREETTGRSIVAELVLQKVRQA